VLALSPQMGDFNDDLRAFGPAALRSSLLSQLASKDVVRCERHGNILPDLQ
jgi:hypothetical protein